MNDISLPDWQLTTRAEQGGVPAAARPDRLLYLLRRDMLYATDMAIQLVAYGYHTVIANDIAQLLKMIAARAPDCVILDCEDCEATLPADAKRIRAAAHGTLPILLTVTRGTFAGRLAAARAGVDGYFMKPLDFPSLAERLDELTSGSSPRSDRVLVVCDDLTRSAFYQGLLAAAGIESLYPQRPAGMLRMLDQFHPDAILLDVETPVCSASDLLALMRQDRKFDDIPAIVLAARDDAELRQSVIGRGADEILPRTEKADELVSVLKSRIERYRTLRGLIMRDRMTGLYNHAAFKEQLRREIARAQRERKTMALAMLDLDHFKQINDTHGHTVGDAVLRSIARLLRHRLRNGDVIGRYGGEEFGIIMPGSTPQSAAEVINEIRIEFHAIHHRGANSEFRASFTAGIAGYGENSGIRDPAALIKLADDALYRGKKMGRNRIEIAED